MSLTQVAKSERSQAAILEAALGLFSTQGYRGTSIREIAEAAGLSTGNVYHHFPDKEAIFRTLLEQYWEALDSAESPFNKALVDGAFPDDLEALARAAAEAVSTYRRQLNLIYVDVVEFEGFHLRKYYGDMPDRFATFLAQGHPGTALQDKLAPGVNPKTAVMVACRVFLNYYAVETLFGVPGQFGLDSEETIREVAEILRHGMLRPSIKG